MRVVVLADTHVPDHADRLPRGLVTALGKAELILHAGDVTAATVLDELAQFAPVRVAMGNNDRPSVRRWGAREAQVVDVDGARIALLHDAGPALGRARRMRRRFPDADLVVFGHSHIPLDLVEDGTRLFNPGSPTWKRRQPAPTYGVIDVVGRRLRARIVSLR
ncbi:MAG TPA: metallophosphoesterase family protein [Candidatus Dormibacteraeota bacterium]|jgi:putative phosphoesterase|nr:metallophosphoesterase family protein [Candidatus Dormibacteraeota bacterium]